MPPLDIDPEMNLPRYKYVVQVVIGEQRGEGVRMGSRCFWDSETDNVASETYVNVRAPRIAEGAELLCCNARIGEALVYMLFTALCCRFVARVSVASYVLRLLLGVKLWPSSVLDVDCCRLLLVLENVSGRGSSNRCSMFWAHILLALYATEFNAHHARHGSARDRTNSPTFEHFSEYRRSGAPSF